MRAIRKRILADKYPGTYKESGNGGEAYRIPLSGLSPEAQARYWLAQAPAAAGAGESRLDEEDREFLQQRYNAASPKCQARAQKALAAVTLFFELVRGGMAKMDAYARVREVTEVKQGTTINYLNRIKGLPRCDWGAALLPELTGRTNARMAEFPGDSWPFFMTHRAAPGANTGAAWAATAREAERQGWGKIPSHKTFNRRWFDLPETTRAALSGDRKALERLEPKIERGYSGALHEEWSIDGRRIDLMCIDPAGKMAGGKPFRLWFYPMMDVRSRYITGYAFGDALTSDLNQKAFINAVKHTGRVIPIRIQSDNGMETAAKGITGGSPFRRRGKVKEGEPIGLYTDLGIEVTWAIPGRGRSKPVERLFKTLKDVEMHPEFRGAYLGNRPEARPEEWDKGKCIPVADVIRAYEERIRQYHRSPHKGSGMGGKSPIMMYEELMHTPGFVPRRITEAQFDRLRFSRAEVTLRRDGRVYLDGWMYWSKETADAVKGQGYFALFDPEDYSTGIDVYRGHKLIAKAVKPQMRGAGHNKEDARAISKAQSQHKKAVKAQARATQGLMSTIARGAKNLQGAQQEEIAPETGEILPVASVAQMVPGKLERPREKTAEETEVQSRVMAIVEEMNAPDPALFLPKKRAFL
ncbi:MAG: DDE-type integrase/transposase/recombinase [Zoogloeaceae bacterium]|nr:DDE-type integrase/transposase/recombinase [Zoogloeaceae bacterium]